MSWFLDFLMLILIDENHSLSGYGYTNRTMHTRVALAMHTTVLCILEYCTLVCILLPEYA